MSADAIVSLPSPGAGRKFDQYGHDLTSGTWGTVNGIARPGVSAPSNTVQVYKQLAGLTDVYFKGRCALKMIGAAQCDYSRYFFTSHRPTCERQAETIPDDYAVGSVRAIIAFDPFPQQRLNDEMGLTIVNRALDAGLGYRLPNFGNTSPGISFGPTNETEVQLVWFNSGGVIQRRLYQVATSAQNYKLYELRAVAATASADPYFVGFINGKQITDRIKISQNILDAPPIYDGASEKGYRYGFVYNAGNAALAPIAMYYSGMHLILAPTEAALA